MIDIWNGIIKTLNNSIHFVWTSWWTDFMTITPLSRGIILQIITIIILILVIRGLSKTKFGISFSLLFENMYEFFEEILGKGQKKSVKIYIITLFFIILISNTLNYLLDFARLTLKDIDSVATFITIPTTSFAFNLALATVSVLVMIYIQIRHLGIKNFFLEYIPITGKKIIDVEKGNMNPIVYYPLKLLVKLFDICISLFVGALDIVGLGAKVISLTSRLYGNMLSGGILLSLLVIGTNGLTNKLFGMDFPVITPLILFVQGILVTIIQSFVFPLLIAISIKMINNQNE